MSLAGVTGQERARAQVAAWFASGRLPHAVLITGHSGVGKRRLALELAKAILCGRSEADACDACPSCHKVEGLRHPNLHVLLPLPTGGSRPSGEAESFAALREAALEYLAGGLVARSGSNIPKEHIQLVQREMSFAPTEAPKRVALLFEADCMHPAGANSLLKILEEPPRHAVFLLVSAAADRLLPTIVSRCQRLPLRPLPGGDIRAQLLAQGADPERANLAARLAVGNRIRPDRVLAEGFDGQRDLAERFLECGLRGREDEYWVLLDELGGRPDKERMEAFLELCSAYLRDLFLVALGRGEHVANHDRRDRLSAWSRLVAAGDLDRIALCLDGAYDSLHRNVNPQLLLADLWVQLRRSGAAFA